MSKLLSTSLRGSNYGTLPVENGGTGITAVGASGNLLTSNGLIWVSSPAPISLPTQTANSGKYLTTDGTTASWAAGTGTGTLVLSTSPTLVTPILGTPTSGNFSTGTFTWPTFNQNTSGTAAGLSATLAVASGGTGVTTSTGTGSVVLSTSPTLVTPILGTPTSGTLTNCTGYTFTNIASKPTTLSGYGITDAINSSLIGAVSGIAPLGSDSKIAATYLPSYVDDILEYANLAGFPGTGETGKIYVAIDTNKIYRWSGSAYIEVSPTAGNSDTATKLATARSISTTGDATWTVSFDGSANVTAAITLANVVTAATGTKVTYNAKGLITGSTTLTVSDITDIATSYQAKHANLTTISALSIATTGLIKLTNGVASFDSNTYVISGGALGTPSSGTLTNCTGLPYAGLTGTVPTWNQNTSGTAAGLSATLAVASGGTGVTTSTGTGSVVLSTSPTLVTPLLGTPTSGNFSTGTFTWPTFNQNTTGTAAGLSATLAVTSGGTGVTTSTGTGNNVLSTSPTLVTPILGTPTSGDLSNCTNAIAYSLKSATTLVSVSASSAPASGQVLTATSSTTATWQAINGLPTQTSNGGKYLTTDGTNASWSAVGLTATPVKTANYTAVANDLVRCNSTAGVFNIVFPGTPADGTIIGVIDINETFGTNNVTIVPTNAYIEGDANGYVLDITGTYVSFIYNVSTTNWRLLVTPTPSAAGTSQTTVSKSMALSIIFGGI